MVSVMAACLADSCICGLVCRGPAGLGPIADECFLNLQNHLPVQDVQDRAPAMPVQMQAPPVGSYGMPQARPMGMPMQGMVSQVVGTAPAGMVSMVAMPQAMTIGMPMEGMVSQVAMTAPAGMVSQEVAYAPMVVRPMVMPSGMEGMSVEAAGPGPSGMISQGQQSPVG